MKRRISVLIVISLLMLSLILLIGCGRKSAVPVKQASQTNSEMPPPDPVVAALSAWAQSLGPQDRQALEGNGRLTISYGTLKILEPAHAKAVDEFFDQQRSLVKQAAAPDSKMPKFGSPQTITFLKDGTGQIMFVLETTTKASFRTNLPASLNEKRPNK